MRKRVIIFAIIVVTGMLIAGLMNKYYLNDQYYNTPEYRELNDNRLVIINPTDVNSKLVDSSIAHVAEGHVVGDFSFINQLGKEITQKDLEGKIYVVDFFFTTCGSICPKMTRQLERVQKEFNGDLNFKILSHTVNPRIDSVDVMKAYSERFEVNDEQWWFLTGSKEELYKMARKSYLVVPDEKDPDFKHGDESDFIHTENFVLIDPDKRIRGMYDGTNPDEVSEMIKDVYDLKREYKLK